MEWPVVRKQYSGRPAGAVEGQSPAAGLGSGNLSVAGGNDGGSYRYDGGRQEHDLKSPQEGLGAGVEGGANSGTGRHNENEQPTPDRLAGGQSQSARGSQKSAGNADIRPQGAEHGTGVGTDQEALANADNR